MVRVKCAVQQDFCQKLIGKFRWIAGLSPEYTSVQHGQKQEEYLIAVIRPCRSRRTAAYMRAVVKLSRE